MGWVWCGSVGCGWNVLNYDVHAYHIWGRIGYGCVGGARLGTHEEVFGWIGR